jgi:hypothetical protein
MSKEDKVDFEAVREHPEIQRHAWPKEDTLDHKVEDRLSEWDGLTIGSLLETLGIENKYHLKEFDTSNGKVI